MSQSGGGAESDSVVEVKFRVTDPSYPLVAIPEQTGCSTHVEQIMPNGDNTYSIFHSFSGASDEDVLAAIEAYEALEARMIDGDDAGGIAEIRVNNPEKHFVASLTDAGAIPRHLSSADGVAHIVAEIPNVYDTSKVVARFQESHPSVTVAARRQKSYTTPLFSRRELQRAVEELLTDRQREVLLAAYEGGYFESPREKSGEAVASELGISLSTFSQHLRSAEQKLCSLVFEALTPELE
ncbi:helix-turn-helix domain-containing protein [Halorussus halophilus]|uniref:helix-turn-helix domain-containing protein n=1 Tax=Halorussus halophilus TaxID=2650975 RepID=UPI00130122EC|nr:bacterio-opsin activator domain-containing protein [Halorussus halophilus]